jgi:molybdopterin synthase catalytic subunit
MFVTITESPIDINNLIEKTRNEDAGAIVTFQGTVRRFTGELEVESLIYESYNEMAEKTMIKICQDALEKYNVIDINVVHRIGKIELKEDSVAICVASAHRKDAFLACEYVIDTIKEKVPIWKKDVTPKGEQQWHD